MALHQELVGAEAARRTERADALDYILRGRAAYFKLGRDVRENDLEALAFFERALALDPDSVEAKSWVALELAQGRIAARAGSDAADLKRSERLADEALAVSPRGLLPHLAKGFVLSAQRRYEDAIPEYEMTIAIDRNWWYSYSHLA